LALNIVSYLDYYFIGESMRIQGIDLARSFAIIGMIIVNFKIVFGADYGSFPLLMFTDFLSGKAAALFVTLAGLGVSLFTNSSRTSNDFDTLNKSRKDLIVRAVILFVIGLSYMPIWPADILHYYGIFILVGAFLISSSNKTIIAIASIVPVIFLILISLIDYETNWNMQTYEYFNFWTPIGFITNLFYNGFHPVIPWLSIFLMGMLLGRFDLNSQQTRRKILRISSIVFIATTLLSLSLVYIFVKLDPSTPQDDIIAMFGTRPMPPMPLYLLSGISLSYIIVILSIIIGDRAKDNFIVKIMSNTGKLALTFYVAHVLIGMGVIDEIYNLEVDTFSIDFAVYYALGFSLLCIVFANLWLRKFKLGPLEYLFKWVAGKIK
jgi:uncharacterized protein